MIKKHVVIIVVVVIFALIGYLIYVNFTINNISSPYMSQVPSVVGNGKYTLPIPISIRGGLNNAIAGVSVQASTDIGSVSGCTTNDNGNCNVVFTPPFTSSASTATINVNAEGLTQSIYVKVNPNPTEKLSLQSQFSYLLADGRSSTIITITAYDSTGSTVPDGTQIYFALLSQGAGGTTSANSCTTLNGKCQVTYTASTTAGVTTFQVSSYSAVNSLQITLRKVNDLQVYFYVTPKIGKPVVPAFALNHKYLGKSMTTINISNYGYGPFTGTVQLSIPGWSNTVSGEIYIYPRSSISVDLNPDLNDQAFSNNQEQSAIYLLTIQNSDGQTVVQNTYETSITSFNTMDWFEPYYGKGYDTRNDIIAAWVQIDAPGIHQLLSDATSNYLPEGSMIGYGTYSSGCGPDGLSACDQAESTKLQLKAIYNQLQRDGMVYVNAPVDFSGTQTVYTPAQSLKVRGANCIDGTLVFASALSAIGMQPYIDIVPGHAFVSVLTYPNSGRVYSVETTEIGSGATFEQALNDGKTEFEQYSNQNQLREVDVNKVLSSGVKSLPS